MWSKVGWMCPIPGLCSTTALHWGMRFLGSFPDHLALLQFLQRWGQLVTYLVSVEKKKQTKKVITDIEFFPPKHESNTASMVLCFVFLIKYLICSWHDLAKWVHSSTYPVEIVTGFINSSVNKDKHFLSNIWAISNPENAPLDSCTKRLRVCSCYRWRKLLELRWH